MTGTFDSGDLPALRQWRAQFQPPPHADAYLAEKMDVTSAVLFAELLAPAFLLVRNCVIMRSRYESDKLEQWLSKQDGDTAAVEQVINHLHLWDIFTPDNDEEEHALEELAHHIARGWHSTASRQFPARTFHTTIDSEYGPTISIYSRPSSTSPSPSSS